MTARKTATAEQPDLLPPMKDVTPKKADAKKPEPKPTATKPKTEKPVAQAARPARQAVAVRDKNAPATGSVADTAARMVAILADVARDPNADAGKAKAFLDMQMEVMREQARREFNAAFLAMEMPVIPATGRIEIPAKREGGRAQSTPYAKFPVMMEILKPILKKHGFTLSYSTSPSPDNSRIIVSGYLKHVGGHEVSTSFPLPAETSGSKNNVQGWGSSMSYGKRYCTVALLNIVSFAPEDADSDGGGADAVITAAQVKILRSALTVKNAKESRLTDWLKKVAPGIERIEDMPADLFDKAHTLIQGIEA